MKWAVDEFMTYLKTPPSSELDAFKKQNTVYAVFILLEALAVGEAMFRDGVLTLDDVQYDCKDRLPTTAVNTYGFGLPHEAYDETVGRGIVGLLEGIYLLRAEDTVSALEDAFAEICGGTEARLDWNYYGAFAANDSTMPEAWAERAAALFAPAVAAAHAPPAVAKPPRFFSKAHTRRMHGKRALSPIRRTRGTATTRRRNNKQPLTVDATEKL